MPKPPLRSLPTLLEDLEDIHSRLADNEQFIPVDSPSLIKLETAVKALEELADEAEVAAGESDDELEDNEDDSDEG